MGYLLSVPQRPVPIASLVPARKHTAQIVLCNWVTQQQTVASVANKSKQIQTNPYKPIQHHTDHTTCSQHVGMQPFQVLQPFQVQPLLTTWHLDHPILS